MLAFNRSLLNREYILRNVLKNVPSGLSLIITCNYDLYMFYISKPFYQPLTHDNTVINGEGSY
jgi:hypothetical protein